MHSHTEGLTSYVAYLATYLGVALVAGSVVHIGTVANGTTRYFVLAAVGLCLMLVGNIMQARKEGRTVDAAFVFVATCLAIATGFLSGGIQHYLDNPIYAGYLLGIGLVVSLVAYFKKESYTLTGGLLGAVILFSVGLIALSSNITIVHNSHEENATTSHH